MSGGRYLFVLESPNKVKKIQEYLGNEYLVTASKGHFRTLGNDDSLGIQMENNFEPEFYIDPKKRDVVAKLKAEANRCDTPIYLATDYDREGEAISWHIQETLGATHVKRVVFTEITKPAILAALNRPKDLDMHMVNSQIARQVLDKLIGFKVSPCLWKEFKNWKLSAGRVQSVVTKLIIEREQEILAFASANYFKMSAGFCLNLDKIRPTRVDLSCELETRVTNVDEVANMINNTDAGLAKYYIDSVGKTKSKRQPSPPYITSSLQQDASNKLGGMSPDATMSSAQKLYEAGLITYMRTDSLMLSQEALGKIGDFIKAEYGENYHRRQQYTKKAKGAQEAHEAIRPTDVKKTDVGHVAGLTARDIKLYKMIWRRTVASQMSPADIEVKTVKVVLDPRECQPALQPAKHNPGGGPYTFVAKHDKVLFDGFLKLYAKAEEEVADDDAAEGGDELPTDKKLETLFDSLKKGMQVGCGYMTAEEKQTKPPNGRYTEASLVKKLEDLGIGRPSTYATMVSKVQERSYVEKKDIAAKEREFRFMSFKYPKELDVSTRKVKVDGEKNKLCPSSLGIMLTGFLIKNFELFMDYGFTANVENMLDQIAEGQLVWHTVVRGIWDYLYPIISRFDTMDRVKAQPRELGLHPTSGNPIKLVRSRTGWLFLEENPTDKKANKFAQLGFIKPEEATLADAVASLVWPKNLGLYNNEPVMLHKKKNYYLTYMGKNYSMDTFLKENNLGQDDAAITLDVAIQAIAGEQAGGGAAAATEIRIEGAEDYLIKKGPYGYYIKYLGSFNIPFPPAIKKNIALATKDNCDQIIKVYLTNKGKTGSITDIKIKPAEPTAVGKAGARTKKPAVPGADDKPKTARGRLAPTAEELLTIEPAAAPVKTPRARAKKADAGPVAEPTVKTPRAKRSRAKEPVEATK